MPWSNQSGGGGPWGQRGGSGGGKSPWGSGGPQGNGAPPDLEDILRRSQDRLKDYHPRRLHGRQGLIVLVLGVIAVWLLTGFYTVRPSEVGINMIFGKYTGHHRRGPSLQPALSDRPGDQAQRHRAAADRSRLSFVRQRRSSAPAT